VITTFEAGAVFKIIDEATPVLRTLSRGVAKLDEGVEHLRTNLRALGRAPGIGPLADKLGLVNAELSKTLASSAQMPRALGGAFGTLNARLATASANAGKVTASLPAATGEIKLLGDAAGLARTELSGMARSLGLVDRRVGALAATVGTSRPAIASAFSGMSAGASAALADVRALNAQWRALALSVGAASRALRLPGARPSALPRGGGGRGGGFHVSGMSQKIPGGHVYFHGGNNAAMAGLGALAYGVYEESEVEDIAARAMITGQIKVDAGMRETEAFRAIRDVIATTSTATGFSPKEVGEAILTTERQFGGLDFMKRLQIEKTLLPFAAAEARLKETTLPEAFQSLVGLVHMTGTYNPEDLPKLSQAFSYASMITPVELPRFERALSYSLPILHAGMNMDPSSVMFLTAMAETAGITNTKSGTWIREFFARLMPDTRGTKTALEHNRLERSLGLLSASDQPTWFVKDAAGKVDWMSSLSTLSHDMSVALARIPDTERLGVMKQIWGAQGGGFGALMNLPQFVDQLTVLQEKMRSFQGGDTVIEQLTAGSPVQKARNAFADMQNVLMDIGDKVLPPLTVGLETFDSLLKVTTGMLPSTAPAEQDSFFGGLNKALGLGMAEGAVPGAAVGGAVGLFGGFGVGAPVGAGLGAAGGALVGGAYEGGKYIWSALTAPKTEVSIQPGKVAINLDGRQIADAVVPYIVKQGAGPAEGAPYHDPTYSTTPYDVALPL
jgi:hypothetical protein